jgi:hypothetical protein
MSYNVFGRYDENYCIFITGIRKLFFTRDKINFVKTSKPILLTCFLAAEVYTAWSLGELYMRDLLYSVFNSWYTYTCQHDRMAEKHLKANVGL